MLNPRLDQLIPYPFERLTEMLGGLAPAEGMEPILMSLGEPRHEPPDIVAETLAASAADWGRYPPLRGTPGFRAAVADWVTARYGLEPGLISADANVLPVAGTREALFMIALAAVPQVKGPGDARPLVLVPNPLYHVYSGAAVMAGAEPVFLPATAETRFLPDFHSLDPEVLERTALVYLCSPANPQGSAMALEDLRDLIESAMRFDFILAMDECYSEIYFDAPPAGALEAAASLGDHAAEALDHVVVFNSLSKRSGAPGLRSGFIAGGAEVIAAFAALRNFASVQSPLPVINAAEKLWRDEAHVEAGRRRYREKLDIASEALGEWPGFYRPDGGFFLWLDVGDGMDAAQQLWTEAALRVLPGSCLCPPGGALSEPGAPYIRLALVHEPDTIAEALSRLRRVLNQ
ncbi:MAG TPA: aminotransferase class I/II-fold pyridoxal phosphate-dependent enzyme [Alphaproteobacteria bacterium]|nr:aminotransferase class I/II-fold pyridoxal phosphate-dependent enzyme [Alphaproteobacteria bacterium]